MATRGATTGAVTAWAEPDERDKRLTLSAVYEMSGIKPPTDNVERWIIAGWPHVCSGLTVAQVQEAFMLCMAGRLRDADGQAVTLDLYGRQFALQDFARVIAAYRSMLAELRFKEMQRMAAIRQEEEERRRNELTEEDRKRMRRGVVERAYESPDTYSDWGNLLYDILSARNLLAEIASMRDAIVRRAEERFGNDFDRIRAVLDRRYRDMYRDRKPDIEGELVRGWFREQKRKGVSIEQVFIKMGL